MSRFSVEYKITRKIEVAASDIPGAIEEALRLETEISTEIQGIGPVRVDLWQVAEIPEEEE
jgi:hypothetical protein